MGNLPTCCIVPYQRKFVEVELVKVVLLFHVLKDTQDLSNLRTIKKWMSYVDCQASGTFLHLMYTQSEREVVPEREKREREV